ncbi:hypothetical protein BROUX41_005118 [Berkeleyomyces rouxiae]
MQMAATFFKFCDECRQTQVASRWRPQKVQYYPRGHISDDDSAESQARTDRNKLQRDHRSARRQGEVPTPTPSIKEFVRPRRED